METLYFSLPRTQFCFRWLSFVFFVGHCVEYFFFLFENGTNLLLRRNIVKTVTIEFVFLWLFFEEEEELQSARKLVALLSNCHCCSSLALSFL